MKLLDLNSGLRLDHFQWTFDTFMKTDGKSTACEYLSFAHNRYIIAYGSTRLCIWVQGMRSSNF